MNSTLVYKVKFWQLWKRYILNAFKHERENFHVGTCRYLDTDTIEEILITNGWQPNYFSFADEGQVTSMRKMFIDDETGTWRQYHIRVHTDGEIRGHTEYAYEEDAIGHLEASWEAELPGEIREEVLEAIGVSI